MARDLRSNAYLLKVVEQAETAFARQDARDELLARLERLEWIEQTAAELADQPFGSLNERSFYRLREALDV